MALHPFRAKADFTLKKGEIYTVDTVSGEIYKMSGLAASEPQPAPAVAPPVVETPAAVAPVVAAVTPVVATKKSKIRRRTNDVAEKMRNELLVQVWEKSGLRANEYVAHIDSYKELAKGGAKFRIKTDILMRSDLDRLEVAGFVRSRREPDPGTPAGVSVHWDITEAGVAEARKIRAGVSEAQERGGTNQAVVPFVRALSS